MCHRKCVYRTETLGCNYSVLNDKTRLAQVYKMLGVTRLTPEAVEMMRPRNCPFFEKGKRRKLPVTHITLSGSQVRTINRRLSFNEAAARELYRAGANDHEIAEAMNVNARTIAAWRKRNGLPSLYWRKNRG